MPIDPVIVATIIAEVIAMENRMPIDVSEIVAILLAGVIIIGVAIVIAGWAVISLWKRRRKLREAQTSNRTGSSVGAKAVAAPPGAAVPQAPAGPDAFDRK
jgi:heme/copper-type cytochrome/quinol oxidase subunit 2